MIEIADYEQDVLERLGLFDRDIVVCATNDDDINRKVAKLAKHIKLSVSFADLKAQRTIQS